ncbi:nucleoside hydrolase [Telluribacter sp.]|jgi:inosine-uridine nucleoside N-ribohydrolase|uniref:nucleoside hydrolase n=1 Tax=Telluribacter sp. TaxID=1978767 RepID=UPI002E1054AB|nr:nucleoside hydrolase [Telluribacter sp.]
MNNYPKIVALIALVLLSFSARSQQYNVILDADIDSDVDDVEALAMVHTLADQKKINFLGVVVTSDDPYAPLCTSAINQYFGRPALPIGYLKNQPAYKVQSKYTRQISEEFPRRLRSYQEAEEAATLYRKLLSESPDGSVVIITIGHLTSLQNLLQSGADKYSPMSGKELVRKKVAKWLCMGGNYPEGKEANFYRPDPASTVYCLQEWEKPVTFVGWDVGNVIKTGGPFLKSKLSADSPVYRAYELYNNFQGRASWDQVAVYLLMEEAGKYFSTVSQGYCHVNEDGSNQWRTDKDSLHEYVVLKPDADVEAIARSMDKMAIR